MNTEKKGYLGFWMLSALVAGNMIGSGIYLLPSALAKIGSISLLSWFFTACGAILLAIVFSSLATVMPMVGGPYAYCKKAYGDFIGFLVAYNYWIAIWVGNAAIAVAFTGYLSFFFPNINNNNLLAYGINVSVVWFLTFVNIMGVRAAGLVQLITTILKVLPLFLLFFVGVFYIKADHLSVFNVSGQGHFGAFISAATLTLWSFIGLESATLPANKVKNPKKTIARATIFGTLLAACLYIVTTAVVMGTVPNDVLASTPAPYAYSAGIIFGKWGSILIGIGAIISCFGTLNGWILLQGTLPYAVAKDKLFPAKFGTVDKKGTPVFALVISSILITLVLTLNINENLVDQFTFVISLAVFATLLPYIFTAIGELILFITHKEEFSSLNLTKHSIISIAAFIYSIWMVYGAGHEVVFYGLLLMLSGLPIYTIILLNNSRRNER